MLFDEQNWFHSSLCYLNSSKTSLAHQASKKQNSPAGSLESVKESVRVAWGTAESNSSQRAKEVVSDSPGLVDFAFGQVNSVLKVARYSFSGSIPPKFEQKLSRHKQRFGKIATTVVSDKDENLLWLRLQWDQSCHSSKMALLSSLLAAVYLGTGNCSSKIIYGSFFLQ